MSRPRIGIAPTRFRDAQGRTVLAVRPPYLAALDQAGAMALMIGDLDPARAADWVAALDGLVVPGGPDLHPRFYREEAQPGLDLLDDDLGELYLALLRAARSAGRPTLGICLGLQAMNVALGGSLVQDLGRPSDRGVRHIACDGGDERHQVEVEADSRLGRALGAERPNVACHHHQAVARLAPGLRVVARAGDGVVEGVEIGDEPFYLAVQWHPERSLDEPANRRLFASFVAAAAGARPGNPVK